MPEIFEPYRPLPEWLEEAIQKYKAKLDFAVLEPKLREIKSKMDTNAIPQQVTLHDLEMKVVKILNKNSVLSDMNVAYCTFALQLQKVKQKFHPSKWAWLTDYKRELKILAQKWVARGLDKNIMLQIAKVVGTPQIQEYL